MSDQYRYVHLLVDIVAHTIASMYIEIQEGHAVLMQVNVARMLMSNIIKCNIQR